MPGKPRPAQDSMSCAGRPAGEVTTYSKVVDRHERLRYTLHLHIAEPHLILILSGGFLLTMIERQLLDVSTRSRKRISMSHAVYMECVGGLVDCTNNLENFPSCIDIEIH